jgi:hypothetical protein
MKMVKSLLLGSAAGLVAVAGAQAADLPVKAKPVEYVKICSLYGAGFYYMPGTNLCIKIGGYVRYQNYFDYGSTGTASNLTGGFLNSRIGGNQDFIQRARTILSADVRTQTEYGTLRAYMNVGHTGDGTGPNSFPGTTLYANRAFLQFAGFTMGLASSYFDFYSSPAVAYLAAHPGSDTGDGGWKLIAYTAQLGNGVSATLSFEEPRRTSIWNVNSTSLAVGALPGTSYGNSQWPDIVGNLRIDQAWGSAQIMAAAHQVRSGFYTPNGLLSAPFVPTHPDDDWGYALGAGLRLKMDYITPGSYFQGQVTYAKGAVRYLAHTPFGASYARYGDSALPFQGTVGLGWVMDAMYTNPGGFAGGPLLGSNELTSGWTINASYEHVWNPKWKTSIYGGYTEINYSAAASFYICNGPGGGIAFPGGVNAGCNADWSTWWLGSRTQWNITPFFYLGVDVLYQRLNSMDGGTGNTVVLPTITPRPGGTYLIDDQNVLGVTFRAHFDFLP